MPALAPVTGVARCVVSATANGVNIVNVFHVANDFPTRRSYSQSAINSLASSFASLFTTHIQPNISSNWANAQVTCTDLTSSLGVVAVQAITGAGGNAGTAAPQQACACISWKIARHYRGGHPRTYVGPLTNTQISNPTSLTAALVTALGTGANALRTGIAALTIETYPQSLVCVHRVINGVTEIDPEVDVITGASVDTRIDTMRRRLGKDR